MATFGKVIRAAGCEEETPEELARSPAHREQCIREDLIKRLTHICEGMDRADFEGLIVAMTREQLRSERLH